MENKANLLLIGSSYNNRNGYFNHCKKEIKNFLGEFKKDEYLVSVPYALPAENWGGYTKVAHRFFGASGYKIISVHESDNVHELILGAKAIVVNEAHTNLLMYSLREKGIFDDIRTLVKAGELMYLGNPEIVSATIRISNSMPIFALKEFGALNVVPFYFKSHFLSAKEHMGQIQREEIKLFIKEHKAPVIGIPESCVVTKQGDLYVLDGNTYATIFREGGHNSEWEVGQALTQERIFSF